MSSIKASKNLTIILLLLSTLNVEAQTNRGKGEFLSKCAGMYNMMAAMSVREAPNRVSYYQSLTLQFINSAQRHLPTQEVDRIAAAEHRRIQSALAANDPMEAKSAPGRHASCMANL